MPESKKTIYIVISDQYEATLFNRLKEAKLEAKILSEEFEDSEAIKVYRATEVKL